MIALKFKDPIMSQFPLALAIEPRLLPFAIANGFSMDYKVNEYQTLCALTDLWASLFPVP